MIEHVYEAVEVYTLRNIDDIKPAAEAVLSGKVTLLRVGSVFSFVMNSKNNELVANFNELKERMKTQTMSLVCTYEQAKGIVDRDRVNEDFFRISQHLSSRALIRIPVDRSLDLPFPYNTEDGTVQFLDFGDAHPIRNAFREELASRGCEYLSITSGNIHGAPTIEDFDSAKKLAAFMNIKADFLKSSVRTVVTEIPDDHGETKGSYIILSFCNPEAIEVKRLANKTDREVTERYLAEILPKVDIKTPVIYAL